jgi:hypothetical protein
MKSSMHSLIHFLQLLLAHLRLPSPELDPVLDNSLKRPFLSLYNPLARTTQETQPPYCVEVLITDPLPSNGRPVARVRFRGNMFTESLPSNGSKRLTINTRLMRRRGWVHGEGNLHSYVLKCSK